MKHVCIVFLVILCLFLCSCKGEKYWCEICHQTYSDGDWRFYLVPDTSVDLIACPDCYEKQPTAEELWK